MPLYKEIEDAILALLEPLRAKPPAGIYANEIRSYGGEFNTANIDEVVIQFPAILVNINEKIIEPGGRLDFHTNSISVYVCDQNARGEESARGGDALAGSPGAYIMLESVRRKLHRQNIPGIGVLLAQREVLVGYSQTRCIYRAEYKIKTKEV